MDKGLFCLLVVFIAGFLTSCGNDRKEKVTDNTAPSTWEMTIGGEEYERANVVVPAPGGGYVIAGTIGLGDGSDVYLVKIDNDGGVVWERTIGGPGLDEVVSIVATPDGGYLLAGNTNSMGYGLLDAYLLKVDASGDKSWDNAFGGTANDGGVFGNAIAGGYLLAGTAVGTVDPTHNLVLVRTFPTGALQGREVRDASNGVVAYSGAATADGGAIIVGTDALGGHTFPDVYLLRTDAAGEVVWEHSYGGDVWVHPWAVIPMGDDYVIAGDVRTSESGDSDAYLARVDDSGNPLWTKAFHSDHPDEFHAVCLTDDGGLIIAGWTQASLVRGSEAYLVKTTADGVIRWERTFGGDSFDEAFGVTTTPEGGYLVVGRTASFGLGGGDFYVIKTDSEGQVAP